MAKGAISYQNILSVYFNLITYAYVYMYVYMYLHKYSKILAKIQKP